MSGTAEKMDGWQWRVVASCYLGWTLDALDFFIMVFVFREVAKTFGISVTAATLPVVLTLMMRAVGAFLFGRLADRLGRRPALMASILGYSALGFASGLAPNFVTFMVLRGLFGIAMGGEWGSGASLVMESIPASFRGRVSGILQAGYPSGYLLASAVYGLFYSTIGWRGLFMLGAAPALLVLYIRQTVPESPDWVARQRAPVAAHRSFSLANHAGLAVYAVVLMTCFNFFSHGTQDIYPLFLRAQQHLSVRDVSLIGICYNIGAILGGLAFGALSQRLGRRGAIGLACILVLPMLYPWAFGSGAPVLAVGAFLVQFCVQGAWGVIPAHLNELSPAAVRGTFPGFTYQVGNFISAINLPLQSMLATSLGGDYRWPLVLVAGTVAVAIMALVAFGPEARDVTMLRAAVKPAP